PYAEPIPEFYFRTTQGAFTPNLDAFVIEPDPESPQSLYEILREVFEPFTGYRFRANAGNQLTVAAPAWVNELGLQMRTWRIVFLGVTEASVEWPYAEAPTVTVRVDTAEDSQELAPDTPVVVALGDTTT